MGIFDDFSSLFGQSGSTTDASAGASATGKKPAAVPGQNPYGVDPAVWRQAQNQQLGNLGAAMIAMGMKQSPDQAARTAAAVLPGAVNSAPNPMALNRAQQELAGIKLGNQQADFNLYTKQGKLASQQGGPQSVPSMPGYGGGVAPSQPGAGSGVPNIGVGPGAAGATSVRTQAYGSNQMPQGQIGQPFRNQLAAPAPGEMRNGYRFIGGNPADPSAWQQYGGQ